MTEAQIQQVLSNARGAGQRIQHNLRYLNDPPELDIRQRLTGAYGSERVSSSTPPSSPALDAMIFFEEECVRLNTEIAQKQRIIEDAAALIDVIPFERYVDYSDILRWYYIQLKSFKRIAIIKRCSIRTVRRKRNEAIRLLSKLTKKEGE